jgi:hypothetical protein
LVELQQATLRVFVGELGAFAISSARDAAKKEAAAAWSREQDEAGAALAKAAVHQALRAVGSNEDADLMEEEAAATQARSGVSAVVAVVGAEAVSDVGSSSGGGGGSNGDDWNGYIKPLPKCDGVLLLRPAPLIGLLTRWLSERGAGWSVARGCVAEMTKDAPPLFFLAAVGEYLVCQILDLARSVASDVFGEMTLDTWHIRMAIHSDAEMKALFPDVVPAAADEDDLLGPPVAGAGSTTAVACARCAAATGVHGDGACGACTSQLCGRCLRLCQLCSSEVLCDLCVRTCARCGALSCSQCSFECAHGGCAGTYLCRECHSDIRSPACSVCHRVWCCTSEACGEHMAMRACLECHVLVCGACCGEYVPTSSLATSPSALEHVQPVLKTLSTSESIQYIRAKAAASTSSDVLEQAEKLKVREAIDGIYREAMGIVGGDRIYLPKSTAILCALAWGIQPGPARHLATLPTEDHCVCCGRLCKGGVFRGPFQSILPALPTCPPTGARVRVRRHGRRSEKLPDTAKCELVGRMCGDVRA